MEELFPFAAGAIIGLLVLRIRSTALRIAVFVVLCALVGALASFLAGELAVSWAFVTVDAGLVWLGAVVAITLAAARRFVQR